MKIGSNNSLTYLEPSSWWLKLFRWVGRHQDRPYDIQYTFFAVRMFDFRLYVDYYNKLVVKSGKNTFPLTTLFEIMDFFDKRGDVIVRITLESSHEDYMSTSTPSVEAKFKETCHMIEVIYKNIGLCGGRRKFDDKLLYDFDWERKHGMPVTICPSEWSPIYRFVQKWCPFFIKKLNQFYVERYKGNECFLMLDYVNRR